MLHETHGGCGVRVFPDPHRGVLAGGGGSDDDKRILLADVARDSTVFESVADLNADVLARVRGRSGANAGLRHLCSRVRLVVSRLKPTGGTALAYDAAWLVLHDAAWAQYNEGAMTGLGVARGLRR